MPSFATLLRAPNPGPLTLDGTNTWVLRARPGLPAVVVDPGPPDDGHLAAIVAAGPIAAIIVTHRHLDHVEGVTRLRALLAAASHPAPIDHPTPPRDADEGHAGATAPPRDGDQGHAGGAAPRPDVDQGHADGMALQGEADQGHAGGTVLEGDADQGHEGSTTSQRDAGAGSAPVRATDPTRAGSAAASGDGGVRETEPGLDDGSGAVPVYAADPVHAAGTEPLRDGDRLALAGLDIEIVAAPGHTGDSVCLLVSAGTGERAMFTGDTILGRGTAVVAWPDGNLGDYLGTLDRLSAYKKIPVLPGHGPELPDCGEIAREYRAHRDERIVQVRSALAAGARTPAEVVAHVYPDLEPVLVPAAEWTVRAALAYLDPPHLHPPHLDPP